MRYHTHRPGTEGVAALWNVPMESCCTCFRLGTSGFQTAGQSFKCWRSTSHGTMICCRMECGLTLCVLPGLAWYEGLWEALHATPSRGLDQVSTRTMEVHGGFAVEMDHPGSLEGLTPKEACLVRDHNLLWMRTCILISMARAPHEDTFVGMESPQDAAEMQDPSLHDQTNPSVWKWPAIMELMRILGLRLASFDQACLGHRDCNPPPCRCLLGVYP